MNENPLFLKKRSCYENITAKSAGQNFNELIANGQSDEPVLPSVIEPGASSTQLANPTMEHPDTHLEALTYILDSRVQTHFSGDHFLVSSLSRLHSVYPRFNFV